MITSILEEDASSSYERNFAEKFHTTHLLDLMKQNSGFDSSIKRHKYWPHRQPNRDWAII